MIKKKSAKVYCLGVLLFVFAMSLLLMLGLLYIPKVDNSAAVSSVRRAAVPDGEKANADKITGYFMDIQLEGVEANCYEYVRLGNSAKDYGLRPMSRKTIDTTIIVTFSDVTYKDKPVFISEVTAVNFPAYVWNGDNVNIEGNLNVALHESFYNLFTQKFGYFDNEIKTAKVQLMVLLGNNGLSLYRRGTSAATAVNATFSVKAKIYTEEVPPDVNDPNSPNYRPIGGNGINANPDKTISGFKKWFNNFPQWGKIVVYVLAGVVVLFVVGIIIKGIKWIFK